MASPFFYTKWANKFGAFAVPGRLQMCQHCNIRHFNFFQTKDKNEELTHDVMMTKLWISNEAILQLMQALAVKFKEMEVLDEMTELLGDIDWLEILGLHRFVLRIRLCNFLLTCATFCARKRMTSLGWASKTGASWCIWTLHPDLVARSAASFVKLFQQFPPCSKHTYEHGMPLVCLQHVSRWTCYFDNPCAPELYSCIGGGTLAGLPEDSWLWAGRKMTNSAIKTLTSRRVDKWWQRHAGCISFRQLDLLV